MIVKVENLGKSYKKRKRMIEVLKDFNYKFQSGNLYLIKGESGKGKTTLLTLLALLQKESSGNIYLDDENVSNINKEKKCELRRELIGVVFQDFNLFDGLTVLENIMLLDLAEGRVSKEEALKRAEEVMILLKIDHRSSHYPYELSGGEQQRVGIARAIVKNPVILICDEPVSNIDSDNARTIIRFIDDYCHKQNKLGIVTSHNELFDHCADYIIQL